MNDNNITNQSSGQDNRADAPRLVAENFRGLSAKNLGKRFEKRPVVRGVSLNIQRGEVVGLLGPNGAGKTTCFYLITGLIAPDYGTIVLDGQDVTDLPMYRRARHGIGYLPQEESIFRGLTVENNIRAVLEVVENQRNAGMPCWKPFWRNSPLPICAARRHWPCRVVKDAGLKLPGRWPRGHILFCLMSR